MHLLQRANPVIELSRFLLLPLGITQVIFLLLINSTKESNNFCKNVLYPNNSKGRHKTFIIPFSASLETNSIEYNISEKYPLPVLSKAL